METERMYIDCRRKMMNDMFAKYRTKLSTYNVKYKAGFLFEGNIIHIFAIVVDNDDNAYSAFILSEASIINEFFPLGLYMDTMIVDESDVNSIPSNFKTLN